MSRFNPIEKMANAKHQVGEFGGVNMSIEASTTFTVSDGEIMAKIFEGKLGPEVGGCFLYGRNFNPTVYALGQQLATMEGTEAGYCTASGMSAIACSIFQTANAGAHLVVSNAIYGGSYALFHQFLPTKAGINATFVDITDLEAVKSAIKPNTVAVYTETLSNPTLKFADIPALSTITKTHNLKLIVDNTFCPLIFAPAIHGADIVIHSLTKFINGASDTIAGAICSDKETIKHMMDLEMGPMMLLGPTMEPRQAFNTSLRLAHLPLRMQEHSKRALAFSERIANLDIPVIYPGLSSHPHHSLFSKYINQDIGYGGVFSIRLNSKDEANRLMESLQNKHFGFLAVSLGYYETLMSCSANSTSSELPDAEKASAGITPGLLRISIGLTGTLEQRWQQFYESLQETSII